MVDRRVVRAVGNVEKRILGAQTSRRAHNSITRSHPKRFPHRQKFAAVLREMDPRKEIFRGAKMPEVGENQSVPPSMASRKESVMVRAKEFQKRGIQGGLFETEEVQRVGGGIIKTVVVMDTVGQPWEWQK